MSVFLTLMLVTMQALAQDDPKPKTLGPKIVLAQFAGTWDAEVKSYFKGPDGPFTESRGVETTEAIAGGAALRTSFKFKLQGIGFAGHGLIGFDARAKEFTATHVSNFVTTPYQSRGQYDAERKTLTMLNIIVDASGKEQRQKEVITIVDENTKTIVFYDLVEKNGEKQEVKLMEITLKKQPKD
jgi:hypothetical protein